MDCKTKEVVTESEGEMFELAQQYAKTLSAGDIVILTGEMGVGKTTFTKGLARFFSCLNQVSSPTYSIINEYHGETKRKQQVIVHMDFYRVQDKNELVLVGIEEYFNNRYIVIIEWGELFQSILPQHTKKVEIKMISPFKRKVLFLEESHEYISGRNQLR